MEYYRVLKEIHRVFSPGAYLEIGVRNGESLALAHPDARAYGIDPKPGIFAPLHDDTHLYACTSDEFFERFELPEEVPAPLDMAFIDGMHLFEYALRDFINVETLCHEKSLIILHDTWPDDEIMAARERTTQKWCGDVFKLLLILKKYRPELEFLHYNASPSGLCLIKNLNPACRVLRENYEDILREFSDVSFAYFQENALAGLAAVDFSLSLLESFLGGAPSRKKAPPRVEATAAGDGIPPASRYLFSDAPGGKVRMLGVLLCYNDADILGENIEYLLSQRHDLIVWDHGSTDATAEVLDKYAGCFVERRFISRNVDFYILYQLMSRRLLSNYVKNYDVISWPDQDEILEGPFRDRSYHEYLTAFYHSPYNWIRFNNMNFWYSEEDDPSLPATERIKRYSHFPDCSPRIRAWRASATNVRLFNHNPLAEGMECPVRFNLRHYPCRSYAQMMKRIHVDRAGIERDDSNFHYNALKAKKALLKAFDAAKALRLDDGKELNRIPSFDWNKLYGKPD